MTAAEGATRNIVNNDELLYRCVVVDEKTDISKQIIYDSNAQKYRLSSGALADPNGQLSVDIASKTTPQESLERKPKSGALACLLAKEPENLGYPVVEDPEKENPAHALILSGDKAITKAHRRFLAKKCRWAIPPRGYDMLEPMI